MRFKHRFAVIAPLITASWLLLSCSAFAMNIHASVRDNAGKPVKDAVVYAVHENGGAPEPGGSPEVVMNQLNKEFVPYVMPIQAGTAVHFPNKDDVRHHVYSMSPTKKFELPLYRKMPVAPTVVFDKPGVVILGCNIHDWMISYLYVVETPYFVKTGDQGKAKIEGLPPGAYEVRVWHPRMKDAPEATGKRVTVVPGGGAQADFTVDFIISQKPEWRALRGAVSEEGGGY